VTVSDSFKKFFGKVIKLYSPSGKAAAAISNVAIVADPATRLTARTAACGDGTLSGILSISTKRETNLAEYLISGKIAGENTATASDLVVVHENKI